MIKSSIEKLAENIGYDIGMSDDVTQSNLLNGLGNAICNSMSDDKVEMQLCYVVDKLNPKAIRVIKELCEFIKLKEEKI